MSKKPYKYVPPPEPPPQELKRLGHELWRRIEAARGIGAARPEEKPPIYKKKRS